MPTIPYVDCLHSSGGEISLAGGDDPARKLTRCQCASVILIQSDTESKSLTPLKNHERVQYKTSCIRLFHQTQTLD